MNKISKKQKIEFAKSLIQEIRELRIKIKASNDECLKYAWKNNIFLYKCYVKSILREVRDLSKKGE